MLPTQLFLVNMANLFTIKRDVISRAAYYLGAIFKSHIMGKGFRQQLDQAICLSGLILFSQNSMALIYKSLRIFAAIFPAYGSFIAVSQLSICINVGCSTTTACAVTANSICISISCLASILYL